MKHMKLILSTTLLLLLGLTGLLAQESVNASGGNASGTGGSVSYSVGQIVYTTYTGTNGSVAEGVQQPYEISITADVEEVNRICFDVSVYPNPTCNNLTLSIDALDFVNLSYQIYDMQGKLLQNHKITQNQTLIITNNLMPADYTIRVRQGLKEIKSLRIIKIK
jgi:hypothetical protein